MTDDAAIIYWLQISESEKQKRFFFIMSNALLYEVQAWEFGNLISADLIPRIIFENWIRSKLKYAITGSINTMESRRSTLLQEINEAWN